ncbi:MAG: hypothetical protein KC496_00165 [Anaerolineae bacterium]|nr:hypothetical protein [Anaerolineae bacterium]
MNPHDMSDEDFLKLTPEEFEALGSSAPEQTSEEVEEPSTTEEVPEAVSDEAPAEQGDEEGEADGGEEEATEVEADPAPANDAPAQDDPSEPEAEEDAPVEESAAPPIDYKAEYERITAPFKANGRDIQVNSIDDAIALMQMGANYNKKMAAIKPNLKLMKMLENAGLLSEEKLSYLIDLDKKDPGAIGKLVKDSGIDPLDLSTDEASTYKPKTYAVGDKEMELDTVLDEIQDSPAYTQTLQLVSNKWDAASKQVIAETPQILKVINTHIENGVYEVIQKELERERMFGRLTGLSDIEAYRQVGDAIQARGGFDHLAQRQVQPGTQQPVVVSPKPKQADDSKLRDKRRAASSPRAAAPNAVPQDFNPLAMSDEEFAKASTQKFL